MALMAIIVVPLRPCTASRYIRSQTRSVAGIDILEQPAEFMIDDPGHLVGNRSG